MATSERPDVGKFGEIALAFLRLGATSYGGPAIMGIMQGELQQKRQWVSRDRFVEGLSVVNMLPGATATQLGIFLAYVRGGWWGGLVGGLCFVLPGFVVMVALTIAYAWLGITPVMRGALYGLGPVVLGIVAAILLLAGGVGVLVYHSRTLGAALVGALAAGLGAVSIAGWPMAPDAVGAAAHAQPTSLLEIGAYFFKVGALTVGGGLAMIGFIQAQVVDQFHWLTPREFIDGLALGQFTRGPILGARLSGPLPA